MIDSPDRILADDLEDIAAAIPQVPRGLGLLRQQLALLPNPLQATFRPSLPVDEMSPPAEAADTMAGDGPGTVSGATLIDGSVAGSQIAPGAITAPKMATDVKPIAVVASLPALPNASYPPDTWVYVTGDKKLYKNVADVWTYVINPGDITASHIAANTITAGEIAAGAIGTSELLVGAVLTGGVINDDGAGGALSTVVINPDGIAILNGALTISDQFGTSVMTGAGFGGSWLDFLNRGLIYNGAFIEGSTSDIAVSETGSGTPTSNYLASLSPNLPYWVVSASDQTLKIVADSNAVGGTALEFSGTSAGTERIYQDIPFRPNSGLALLLNEKFTTTSGSFTVKVWTSYRKSDHSIIGSRFAVDSRTLSGTQASYSGSLVYQTGTFGGWSPAYAAYVRVEIEVIHVSGTNNYRLSDLTLSPDLYGSFAEADTVIFDTALFGPGTNVWDADGMILHGARLLGGGTSFPTSGPNGTSLFDGDVFHRKDVRAWCSYHTTLGQWICEDRIPNGDFEYGVTGTNGSVQDWLDGGPATRIVSGGGHSGNYASVDGASGAYTGFIVSHFVPCVIGQNVTLIAWLSDISNAGAGYEFYAQFYDKGGTSLASTFMGGNVAIVEAWTRYGHALAVPVDAWWVRFVIYNNQGAGTALGVDDVTVQVV